MPLRDTAESPGESSQSKVAGGSSPPCIPRGRSERPMRRPAGPGSQPSVGGEAGPRPGVRRLSSEIVGCRCQWAGGQWTSDAVISHYDLTKLQVRYATAGTREPIKQRAQGIDYIVVVNITNRSFRCFWSDPPGHLPRCCCRHLHGLKQLID